VVRRWSHQRSLASSSPVSTGIGDHLWRVNNPVFSRPLRPTQPAHPFLCRCNEHWRWFLPALGKKRRVTRSSHGRLLYASLIGSNPVQLKAQRGWAPSRRTSRCMHKSSYFSSLVLYSVNHLWSEGWLQHVMIFCHSYGSSPSVLIQSVSECGPSIEVLGSLPFVSTRHCCCLNELLLRAWRLLLEETWPMNDNFCLLTVSRKYRFTLQLCPVLTHLFCIQSTKLLEFAAVHLGEIWSLPFSALTAYNRQ